MKRFFLVEANTDYDSLFCYEVFQNGYTYQGERQFRQPDSGSLFNKSNREVFFGTLNSLCVTKDEPESVKMRLAEPEALHSQGPMSETVARVPASIEEPGPKTCQAEYVDRFQDSEKCGKATIGNSGFCAEHLAENGV